MEQDIQNIGAIIFARMDSTRLPGKALMHLGEKKLISWPIDALKDWGKVKVILATSDRAVDDPLICIAEEADIGYYRGSINDLAERALHCAKSYNLDYFYRINGDSPFLNINLLDSALEIVDNSTDLVTNLIQRTYPYGLSCELIKVELLKSKYKLLSENQREHITSYMYSNLSELHTSEIDTLEKDYSSVRWTVDTKEDLDQLNYYLSQTNIEKIHSETVEQLIQDFKKIMKNQIA